MPEKLDQCVKQVKKQAKKEHPEWDDKKVEQYAYAVCVKSTGQHPSDEEASKISYEETIEAVKTGERNMEKIEKIEWKSPISIHESFESAYASLKRPAVKAIYGLEEARLEYLHESDEEKASEPHFYIVGDAIHPVTTDNLHTYLSRELESAASTLIGTPVMVDHQKTSENVAGRVMISAWEERGGVDSAISYVARIRKSHPVAEAVMVGDIDTVSIGAIAGKIECSVCGEDMLYCSHHIGKKYETSEGEKLATAIGRDLKFKELSITPFPADPYASSRVIQDSIFSAMEMLVESSEYKQNPYKKGEKTKMSEDRQEEMLELAERLKQIQAENEQLRKNTEEANQEVKHFREREKAALVDRTFEMEVAANISKSEDETVRRTELRAKSTEVLQAMIENLKKFSTILEKSESPKSKSIVTQERVEEKPSRKPLTYTREEVKAGLRQALGGMKTSEYAKSTVKKFAMDPQNPNFHEYQELVRRNISKAIGRTE